MDTTSKSALRYFSTIGPATGCQIVNGGVSVSAQNAEIRLTAVADTVFRIEVRHPWSAVHHSHAVIESVRTKSGAQVVDTPSHVQITNSGATLILEKNPLALRIVRTDGSVVLHTAVEAEAAPYRYLNDEFEICRESDPNDVILGLGEKTGALNRKGRKFTLWNTDVLNPNSAGEFTSGLSDDDPRKDPTSTEFDPYYMSIPFYEVLDTQGRAAGFFIDNPHRARYCFDEPSKTRIHFAGGSYVEYVFVGPKLGDVIADYTALTGRMPAPPLWSLGYHHCRWYPYNHADAVEIAKRYRKTRIPCDSIWFDIDHMDGYRVFTWNRATYPDPEAMICALQRDRFRTLTIVDPGVKVDPDWDIYQSGLRREVFCRTQSGAVYQGQVWPGNTVFPDFASADAREWWGDLNAKHIGLGISGIWNDMNEPSTGDIPCDAMRFNRGEVSHGAFHNLYATMMARATQEGLARARPEERSFILSRAGSAGIQRYAASWLGDNMSRWDHLALSIPMSLGLGLSGQPFVGTDIGGFGEACSAELLARWFQAASLSPFCRSHNAAGNPDQYPWSFGPEIEAICRTSIELRYRLMPYLYTAFVEASLTGVPVMRPMALDFPDEPELRALGDQYLLGPSLLVAPVCEQGATSRRLVLPRGEWIDWWTGRVHCGGPMVAQAPLDTVPLFVRAGAVVPMWPEPPASTMGYLPDSIDLVVAVPQRDGTFMSSLFEDDGLSMGFKRGERLTTTFEVTRVGDSLRLESSTSGNRYPGMARKSFRILLHGGQGAVATAALAGMDEFIKEVHISTL